ncbi:MAG: hypothetical protein WCG95_00015 [bacterium]
MTPELITTIALGVLAYIVMGVVFVFKLDTCIAVLRTTIEAQKENNDKQFERLEKKQDKHNNLIERMVKVEESTKSAHHRLDGRTNEGVSR